MALGLTGAAEAGGIGNLVFRDGNGNRFYDLGDVPVPGVPLQLFAAGHEPGVDQPVAVTVTNAAGRYLFSGLDDGTYFVFIPNAAFRAGGPLINTRSVPGTPGGPGGDDDAGENGIDSASPTLTGMRSGLVVLTAGLAPVSSETETGDDHESDNVADNETDLTVDFGFERFTSRVGDFVWRDDDRNGLQDAGEPGQPGVQVQLFTEEDGFVAAVDSAADGYYAFAGLVPGSYYLRFPTTVFAYKLTLEDQDGGDLRDSDASGRTGRTPVFTIAGFQQLTNLDAGYVLMLPDLGDYIFEDLNLDGVQDVGEPGLGGVPVERYTAAGVLVDTVWSGAGGYYQFQEIIPGDYYLKFPPAAGGLVLTRQNAAPDDFNDSDPDPASGRTEVFTAQAGLSDNTWDAGYHMPPSTLRGTAWRDLNKNGVRDAGEPGLAGVAVSLLDGDTDEVLGMDVTGADGSYVFEGLPSRVWKVEFSRLAGPLQAYQLTAANAGTDDTVDSDAGPGDGRTPPVLPVNGETVVQDAGYKNVRLGIGNGVFMDANDNGTFQNGEGVSGVTVQLFAGNADPLTDAPQAVTTTSISGIYAFFELSPGSYFVNIPASQFAPGRPLAGYISLPGDGVDDGADDNAGENGNDTPWPAGRGVRSNLVSLTTGGEPLSGSGTENGRSNTLDGPADDSNIDLTVDFGFKSGMTLGNLVFTDNDNNNRATAGEGVAGATVELYLPSAQPGTDAPQGRVETVAGGFYEFAGVMPGSYMVHLPAENFQTGRPLAGHKSLLGNGTSHAVDDGVDENGIDATAPAVSGISSPVLLLVEGAAPTSETGETGAGSDSDDNNDSNGNLTVDFGFLPGLPGSYAAWQQRILPAGSNAPAQDADGDTLPNAYEYLYHLPPAGGLAGASPLTLTADPGTGRISATLVFNPLAADAVPVLTARADLRDGFGSWQVLTGPAITDMELPGGRLQRTWQDLESDPSLAAGTGFLRASASLDTNGDSVPDFTFHTPALGWRERLHHPGQATSGTAFLRPALFRGTVDSAAGPALTLAISAAGGDLAGIFPAGVPCYAEVTGGAWTGHRFEIDESATSGAVLRLLATSPLHTRAIPDLSGSTLVVRPHWTLATLFPPSQFKADTNSTLADQVLAYPRPSFVTYWLHEFGANDRWVRADDSTLADAGALPLPPGEGIFVNRRSGGLTVLDLGEVRPHAMARRLTAGHSMQTSGWPCPASPASAGLLRSDGFTGSINPAAADGLQLWSADADAGPGPRSFRSYFLLHGPDPYRYWTEKSDASLSNRNNETLLMPGRAFFLQLRATLADSLQPCPWTP